MRYCKGRIARKFLIETLMSPALHCRHILSSKYGCKSFLIKPFLRFWPSLSCLQADSASWVWTPVRGSTKLSVDDDSMRADVWQCSHSSVGCPVVAVDFCTWPNASLNNWQQGGCIPSIHYLKIASRQIVVALHYSKYPRILCCSPSPTVLEIKKFKVL